MTNINKKFEKQKAEFKMNDAKTELILAMNDLNTAVYDLLERHEEIIMLEQIKTCAI